MNGNRGVGSLELFAKTSCFLLKLWILLTNWKGRYVFGIRYRLGLLLPLQNFGGKNVLPPGTSRANLEGHPLQHGFPRSVVLSLGKCHLFIVPIVMLADTQPVNHSFFPLLLALKGNSRMAPFLFQTRV